MYKPLPYRPDVPVVPSAVELATDRPVLPPESCRIVGYRRHGDCLVPVYESAAPRPGPTPPRDLSPRPVIDPRAQVLAAGGLFAAGAGWGVAQVLHALAGAGTALGLLVAALLLARLGSGGRSGGRGDTRVTVHNHNRWFGRSSTSL